MARLIDADALELDAAWDEYDDGFTAYSRFQIDNAPTVEAEPVKHGRWVHIDAGFRDSFSCSNCGTRIVLTDRWSFCPNCGAKMQYGAEKNVENKTDQIACRDFSYDECYYCVNPELRECFRPYK